MTIGTYILYIIVALLGVISLYLANVNNRLKRNAAAVSRIIKDQDARLMGFCRARKRYKIIKLNEYTTTSINNLLNIYHADGWEYNGVKDGVITLIKTEYTQE